MPDRQNDAIKYADLDNIFNLEETKATEKDEPLKTENLESKNSKPNHHCHVAGTAADTPNTGPSPVSAEQSVSKVALSRQENVGNETVFVL